MKAPEKFGLSKKPTYEELADYIIRDPDKINTPDRTGILLRDHHMLSWLHDITDFENRQEFADEEKNKEQEKAAAPKRAVKRRPTRPKQTEEQKAAKKRDALLQVFRCSHI